MYVAPGVMTGADQMPLFKGGPALTRHHLPLFLPLAAQEYFGKQYEQLSVTEKQGKWRAKEPLHRGTAFLRVWDGRCDGHCLLGGDQDIQDRRYDGHVIYAHAVAALGGKKALMVRTAARYQHPNGDRPHSQVRDAEGRLVQVDVAGVNSVVVVDV